MNVGGLDTWWPLYGLLGIYGACAITFAVLGRAPDRSFHEWTPAGIRRLTGIPGWAGAMAATAWVGLLIAGIGFYNDVAWHIGRGRDEDLFTAPHTMIVVGLGFITLAAGLGILFATVTRFEGGVRVANLRIPWSAIPLGVLGLTALSGFPLDELWHAEYGIDVTMWSPTHMLMIVGASLSPLATWLALAEAGVRPEHGVWPRILYVAVAWMTLAGLASAQGEFEFGVPQFQLLYLPVLLAMAGGFALVAARIVLGPWWILGVVAIQSGIRSGGSNEDVEVVTRNGGLYIGSAVVVEVVARVLGTERRTRFAVVSGLGIATVGLGTEYLWNQGAHQPWTTALLPDMVVVGALAAVGAGLIGAAFAGSVRAEPSRVGHGVLAAAAVLAIAALVAPFPRHTGTASAEITLTDGAPVSADPDGATRQVRAVLDPPDAADDARWFQAMAWQGGGLVLADMEEESPGVWVSDGAVPVTGNWKAVLRLHRADELMSIPLWFPADPEIGAPEIPVRDVQTAAFSGEEAFLLREQTGGGGLLAPVAYTLIGGIAIAWAATHTLAAARIGARSTVPAQRERTSTPG